MLLSCWKRVVPLLAAAVLTAPGCKNPESAAPAGGQSASSAPTPAAPATPPPAAPSAPADPATVLSGIPGMDFSSLSPTAKRELADVLSDNFCYCGCPHTLGACLKSHTPCKHARRMTQLAARMVSDGVPATEAILTLSAYYQGFPSPRAQFKVDDRMCMGAASAAVTVVEFSDFECPYCAKARPILEAFAKKHAQQVRFCYLPFPLSMHPNAVPAAQAVLWARDQGKFWQMHDALFEHQSNLRPEAIATLATSLGLDGTKLAALMKTDAYKEELDNYRSQGRAAGISGTPSVYFNGRTVELSFVEANMLTHSLEDELEWSANKNAWAAD
ncbi:Periplasmic thiol:disulfide interchange protein DsbA [Myxococcus hansupus]|uniref:Periplasmic thiol:disulfide interchange protein DsbA n=1 Tax=Pseudomyxococcus hansupus TaxID=1297742 RepID=A0A0H4WMW7_9BACT|nr:thioredoxin domain-containing protein [Myxococcus hansupus]AKQ64766.1 Periplasmic thiol:disulfide interchange protein DsbA [Myxococcus hansupus]